MQSDDPFSAPRSLPFPLRGEETINVASVIPEGHPPCPGDPLSPVWQIYTLGPLKGLRRWQQKFRPRFLRQEISQWSEIKTPGLVLLRDQDFMQMAAEWGPPTVPMADHSRPQDFPSRTDVPDLPWENLWWGIEDNGELPWAFKEGQGSNTYWAQHSFTFYPGQLGKTSEVFVAVGQQQQTKLWARAKATTAQTWWSRVEKLLPLPENYFADLAQYLQFNETALINFVPQRWWQDFNTLGQGRGWWRGIKWGTAEELLYFLRPTMQLLPWPEHHFVLIDGLHDGLGALALTMAADKWPRQKTRPMAIDGEDALQNIPLPTAVFDRAGNLHIHNNAFAQLQLSGADCIRLANGQELECNGRIYKLEQQDFPLQDQVYRLFVFQDWHPHFAEIKNINPSELGIISGSIAHELNNPLAGIAAAIEVLKLDQWPPESAAALAEMQRSTQRCRQLVDIFLGFSRARPEKQLSGTMQVAYQEALNLLRFRMVEANTYLEFAEQTAVSSLDLLAPATSVNLPLSTMIIYLMLQELLTAWSHLVLINAAHGHAIRGTLRVSETGLYLLLEQAVPFAAAIKESKLINYLVSMANLDLVVSEREMILRPQVPVSSRSSAPSFSFSSATTTTTSTSSSSSSSSLSDVQV